MVDCSAPEEEIELTGEETEAFLALFDKPAERLAYKYLTDCDPLSPSITVKLRLVKKKPINSGSIPDAPTSNNY